MFRLPKKAKGFTLIELLIVIVILAVLGVVGIVIFSNVTKGARDAARKADVEAIAKAYEAKYLSGYQPITASDFSDGSIPRDPEGEDYFSVYSTDGTGFRVCAALEDNASDICNLSSPTCYCKNSTQGDINTEASLLGNGSELGLLAGGTDHPSSCDPGGTLGNGLVGFWRMNDASWVNDCSTLTISDTSGLSHNGRSCPNSSGISTISAGKEDGAPDFNGVNQYLSIPGVNLPTGDFTYSAWIYSLDNTDDMVFMASDASVSNEFAIHLTTTKVRVNINNSSVVTSTNAFPMNSWNLLTVTRQGSQVYVYVNASADPTSGSNSSVLNFNSCELLLGTDSDSGCAGSLGNYFRGRIDDVRIYDRALSLSEIVNLYNLGNGCFP